MADQIGVPAARLGQAIDPSRGAVSSQAHADRHRANSETELCMNLSFVAYSRGWLYELQ